MKLNFLLTHMIITIVNIQLFICVTNRIFPAISLGFIKVFDPPKIPRQYLPDISIKDKRHLFISQLLNQKEANKTIDSFPNWNYSKHDIINTEYTPTLDEIITLAKETGIFYQSGTIYHGWPGFYDYGPLGVELKRNLKNKWWNMMVRQREDIFGCETPIITHPQVLKSSGHVDKFSDSILISKSDQRVIRVDSLNFTVASNIHNQFLGYIVSNVEDETNCISAHTQLENIKSINTLDNSKIVLSSPKPLAQFPMNQLDLLPSPFNGLLNDLSLPNRRSLLFRISSNNFKSEGCTQEPIGLTESHNEHKTSYLRPETSQGIFSNLPMIAKSSNLKLPFGLAQIGKSFRNEINPKHALLKLKEFEQMEIEYFSSPDDDWRSITKMWTETSLEFLKSIGIKQSYLDIREQGVYDLAHYSHFCNDIIFKHPKGEIELLGVAYRGDYDIKRHQNFGYEKMAMFNPKSQQYELPVVVEPSFGLDRILFALLISSYKVDYINGLERIYLAYKSSIAPIKASILPLISSNSNLTKQARLIFKKFLKHHPVDYDQNGSIGKRYRKADLKGIPYCVTIDFQTLVDGSVTLRDRNTTAQCRLNYSSILNLIDNATT